MAEEAESTLEEFRAIRRMIEKKQGKEPQD